jgi:hypothetical protein
MEVRFIVAVNDVAAYQSDCFVIDENGCSVPSKKLVM